MFCMISLGLMMAGGQPAACSAADSSDGAGQSVKSTEGKTLVVYFSRSGNTRRMAQMIGEATGGELFEIRMNNPYPETYQQVVDQSRGEVASGYCPPLATRVENIDDYDVVFVGYPVWFGTIPPPVRTFLSEYDLAGKRVIPFCTSGGGGATESYKAVRELAKDATVAEGLLVGGGSVAASGNRINDWLKRISILK